MTEITFPALLAVFSGIWLVVRIFFWCRQGRIDWKRELQLLWVYLSTVVPPKTKLCGVIIFGIADSDILVFNQHDDSSLSSDGR